MKKLKNIHPSCRGETMCSQMKEIIVHGQVITLGTLLVISRIGAASPISFVSASIPLPRPVIVFEGKYRGKIGRKKKRGKKVRERK